MPKTRCAPRNSGAVALDEGEASSATSEEVSECRRRIRGRWPRTAAVLRDLAESYEWDARRLDSEAEQRRRGLD